MGLSPLGSQLVATRGSVLWDSGPVASGAVIDSPLLDVTCLDGLYVVADNQGLATAALTADVFLDDGSTAIDSAIAVRTVAAGAKERGTIGSNLQLGSTPALNFCLSMPLPTKMKLHLAAAGAATRRLTVFGR